MDKLPAEVIRRIYEYGSTYKIKFGKVLTQLTAHCFIYLCRICCKVYNRCFCYCKIYRTYLRFCPQVFFDKDSL